MIFALAFVQILGSFFNSFFGLKAGAILTGFFGGLVSSTATTASLARKTKFVLDSKTNEDENNQSVLVYLSATIAMLFEGIVLVLAGTSPHFEIQLILIFSGPIIVSSFMIKYYLHKIIFETHSREELNFKITSLLKLSLIILSILFLSNLIQKTIGKSGLFLLTFFVSLFEVHGSLISNVQMYESGVLSKNELKDLFYISIFSSYCSKVFLITVLGSKNLRNKIFKCFLVILLFLILNYFKEYFLRT